MSPDRAALRPRVLLAVFYFFAFGGLGAFFPYLPLLLGRRGLSPGDAAMVMMIGPLSNLLVPPLWAWVADTFDLRSRILQVACFGTALGVLSFVASPTSTLPAAMGAMSAYCFFRAPVLSLVDAAAHAALGPAASRFALLRVWGSVGFAAFAGLNGVFAGSADPERLLAVSAGAFACAGVIAWGFPPGSRVRREGVLREALGALGAGTMPLFFAANALYYVAHGAHDACLALELHARGHGDGFVGLAWVVAVAAEVTVMFLAPRLFDRLGVTPFLLLGGLASVVRWATFPELSSPGAILASQTLHAFTFGLWYLATVKHVQDRAPEGARSTVQAGAQAVLGAGTIVGYVGGGALFEAHGGAVLFRAAALAAGAALLVYGALARLERRRGGVDVH